MLGPWRNLQILQSSYFLANTDISQTMIVPGRFQENEESPGTTIWAEIHPAYKSNVKILPKNRQA